LFISHIHSIDGRPLLIRLGYSMAPLELRVAEQTGLLLLAVPLVLAFAGYVGHRMTGQALRPLEKIALQAEQITASRLHDRIPIDNPNDELGRIAKVLNDLLARLEASFEQLRRFTSDASHELRTPLASLRGVGEMGLEGEYTSREYRDIIGSMLEEVTRLTHMVESLLTISRADSGQLALKMSDFSLLTLVREAVKLVDVIAEEKEQVITISGDPRLLIRGDRTFLRQAVLNILHNAVKYSPASGAIEISVSSQFSEGNEANVILEIVDHGPGISEEHQSKVFDRFYRVDKGRSRDTGGTGLGLAIAKWAVELHRGSIGLTNSAEGGCRFLVRLPQVNVSVHSNS
jgi:heavy metal sensor kinase